MAARRATAQVAHARGTSNGQQSLRWRQSWRLKTHAHAAAAAAAAGRCLHASTSPPPPPPIPRLVGKYPHTPRSNQSALACPRGCSHGAWRHPLSLPLCLSFSFRPLVLLFYHILYLALSPSPLSLIYRLFVYLSRSFIHLTLNASSALHSTGVIPVASRGTGRGHCSRG